METSAALRRAGLERLSGMCAVKSTYIQTRYRGFLPDPSLALATPAYYGPEIREMLEDPRKTCLIYERDGRIDGYVIYGPEEEKGWGAIWDARTVNEHGTEMEYALISGAIGALKEQGAEAVHLWLLRYNYRARYLFESYGFRPDGSYRKESHIGMEFDMSRYAYRIPVQR